MAELNHSQDRQRFPVMCEAVKEGDIMAFVYYGRVQRTELGGKRLSVEGVGPEAPRGFNVEGDLLIVNSHSADQYHMDVEAPLTKIASYILDAGIRPFTVHFIKKEGEERTMRCRLLGKDSETILGRVMVVDLDKGATTKDKVAIKQVDLRTLKWLILDGVKYTARK